MKTFPENILKIWGDQGRRWLEDLPSLIEALIQQWNLENLKPTPNLSYHYVLMATLKSKGDHVILKIGCDPEAVRQEMSALNFYRGHGCVRVLDANLKKGALLLER